MSNEDEDVVARLKRIASCIAEGDIEACEDPDDDGPLHTDAIQQLYMTLEREMRKEDSSLSSSACCTVVRVFQDHIIQVIQASIGEWKGPGGFEVYLIVQINNAFLAIEGDLDPPLDQLVYDLGGKEDEMKLKDGFFDIAKAAREALSTLIFADFDDIFTNQLFSVKWKDQVEGQEACASIVATLRDWYETSPCLHETLTEAFFMRVVVDHLERAIEWYVRQLCSGTTRALRAKGIARGITRDVEVLKPFFLEFAPQEKRLIDKKLEVLVCAALVLSASSRQGEEVSRALRTIAKGLKTCTRDMLIGLVALRGDGDEFTGFLADALECLAQRERNATQALTQGMAEGEGVVSHSQVLKKISVKSPSCQVVLTRRTTQHSQSPSHKHAYHKYTASHVAISYVHVEAPGPPLKVDIPSHVESPPSTPSTPVDDFKIDSLKNPRRSKLLRTYDSMSNMSLSLSGTKKRRASASGMDADEVDLVDTAFINDIIPRMDSQCFDNEDLIVRKGDDGDCMYFISSGSVNIHVPNDIGPIVLSQGAFFGEIALFLPEKRTVDVSANGSCEVMVLTKEVVDSVLELYPHVQEQFTAVSKLRMRKNEEGLSPSSGRKEKTPKWMKALAKKLSKKGLAEGPEKKPEKEKDPDTPPATSLTPSARLGGSREFRRPSMQDEALLDEEGVDLGFITEIQNSMVVEFFRPGAHIVHAGEEGDCMFFIDEGTVNIHLPTSIIQLSQGSFFGEIALFTLEKRTVDVTAEDHVACYVLTKATCDELLPRFPKVRQQFEELSMLRIRKNKGEGDPADSPVSGDKEKKKLAPPSWMKLLSKKMADKRERSRKA